MGLSMRSSRVLAGRVGVVFMVLPLVVAVEAADLRLVDAAARQDWARVRSLVDQGVEVNGPRADGVTALLWAAHWDDLETVRRLLAAGADTNAADDHGVTPLMRACENASVDVVRALLSAGADANAAQTSGLTPLMLAAGTGSREVVRALLERGADVNPVTQTSGVTALMWAAEASHLDIAHILVESGADVSLAATKGFTPLLLAARNGDIELATLLIAAGADVNQPGSDGAHPLPFAIVSSQDAFALFLLEQGADPNGTLNGVPALHAAAGNVSVWLGEWYRGPRRPPGGGCRGARGQGTDARTTAATGEGAAGTRRRSQRPDHRVGRLDRGWGAAPRHLQPAGRRHWACAGCHAALGGGVLHEWWRALWCRRAVSI